MSKRQNAKTGSFLKMHFFEARFVVVQKYNQISCEETPFFCSRIMSNRVKC